MSNIKRTKETPEEAARLRAVFDTWNAKSPKENTQAAVAKQLALTPAAVSFFLSGDRPLTCASAAQFAMVLGCHVEDFSPRLASNIFTMASVCRPRTTRSSARRAPRSLRVAATRT